MEKVGRVIGVIIMYLIGCIKGVKAGITQEINKKD